MFDKLPLHLEKQKSKKKCKLAKGTKLKTPEERDKNVFRASNDLDIHTSHDKVGAVKPEDVLVDEESIRETEESLLADLPRRPEVDITFVNMGYDVYNCDVRRCWKVKHSILDGVSGVFESSQLTGLMGPSGAGKSTLLNIISGFRVSNVRGTILINGEKAKPENLRKVACYIMQEDELTPFLTVSEYMSMAANLKLGSSADHAKKEKIVKGILTILRLRDCKNTFVLDLSGGETKRLAIALELVSNPAIIFMDEPTSGLDSANCTYVIALLKNLACAGRTIICTIHQPPERVFFMFDKIMVLAKGGRFIFSDNPTKMVVFFRKYGYPCPTGHNPADFAAELAGEASWQGAPITKFVEATKQRIDSRLEKYTAAGSGTGSRKSEKDVYQISYAASMCTQFSEIAVRTFKGTFRDTETLQVRFYGAFFVGLLLVGVYWRIGDKPEKILDNMGMLFFCLLFIGFSGMLPTILTFPTEMNIFRREHLNYWYSMKVYYFATTVAFLPAQIFFPTMFSLIIYFPTYQPWEVDRYFRFLLILILLSILAESYGLVFGCALAPKSAVYIAPVTKIPFVIFSGFLITLEHIPKWFEWMGYVSFYRYGFEGIVQAVYGFDRNLTCSEPPPACTFTNATSVIDTYGLKYDYYIDALVLFGLMCLIRTSAFFVMWVKVKTSR